MTIVQWIDLFTRPIYRDIMVDSLNYCVAKKGLIVHAWVIMSNHVHLIVSVEEKVVLSDVLRDLKKFTSKAFIQEMKSGTESRRKWMLDHFAFAAKGGAPDHKYSVWKTGNEAKELITPLFAQQKLDYVHENPVKSCWVAEGHHYLYSSAVDYSGGKGLVDVVHLF